MTNVEQQIATSVLVIGTGGSGLRAAIVLAERGIDVLIVGNGCAPDGVTQGFLTAVAEVFPTFVSHNKGQPNLTGVPLAPVAANFYSAEGPDLLGRYAPWAVNIMPQPLWIQLGVAFSVLFSGMALGVSIGFLVGTYLERAIAGLRK